MRAGRYFEFIRNCPVLSGRELTSGLPFVVLSPHPDDESLGMGGLIAECCSRGQEVNVVVVTDGSGSHPRSKLYPSQKLVGLRYAEVHRAGLALGLPASRVTFLGLRDTAVPKTGPRFDTAVYQISHLVRGANAATLFVTWEADPHCDHEAAAELAKAVRQMCPGLALWAYPIWGWHLEESAETHQPAPKAVRVDISERITQKRQAIRAHASQMTDLISDDPYGFRFDEKSLAPFLGQYEYFIEVPN